MRLGMLIPALGPIRFVSVIPLSLKPIRLTFNNSVKSQVPCNTLAPSVLIFLREAPLPRRDANDDLDAWVLATAPDAVAYAVSLLRDRPSAEDIVQDCYCRLLEKADLYDLPRDGRKLLFRSITNACINVRERTRPMLRLTVEEDRTALAPDRVAMSRELEEAVAEGLAKLPLTYRAAMELKSLGHSLQEIADALDVTVSNAGVLIHRARQKLAEHLAPFVEDEAG